MRCGRLAGRCGPLTEADAVVEGTGRAGARSWTAHRSERTPHARRPDPGPRGAGGGATVPTSQQGFRTVWGDG